MVCQPFHVVPVLFDVVSAFPFMSVIVLFCLSFYIYCQSFLLSSFFLCVLLVYYLDNLLSNVPILASTSHCQFFISGVIDRISNLDREVSRDG
jgi:hypothetical protein